MENKDVYSIDLGFYPMQIIDEQRAAVKAQQIKEEQEAYRAYVQQCKLKKMSIDDINRELEMVRTNKYRRR